MFSKSLSLEYAGQGISVQNQAPMYVATKMSKIRRPTLDAPSPKAWVASAIKHIGYEATSCPYWCPLPPPQSLVQANGELNTAIMRHIFPCHNLHWSPLQNDEPRWLSLHVMYCLKNAFSQDDTALQSKAKVLIHSQSFCSRTLVTIRIRQSRRFSICGS